MLVRVLTTIILLSSAQALAGQATSCDVKVVGGMSSNSDANKTKWALAKRVDERFEKDGKSPSLYFVFADKNGKSEEIVRFPIDDANDRLDLPDSLTEKIAAGGNVKVFNKAETSLYFMPYPVSGIHGINPRTDFTTATHIGAGCSVLDLKGQETLSVLYSSLARTADKIVYIDRMEASRNPQKRTASEDALYAESISILQKKLGTVKRGPASLGRPVYADDDEKVEQRTSKKLPIVPVDGKSRPAPAKKSGDGN